MPSKVKKSKYAHVFRERLNIADHVQGKVMLPCIFHGDSNPSLSVDLNMGVFYCFGGCKEPKGGGPIIFLQKWAEIIDKEPIPRWVARMKARGEVYTGEKLPSAQEHLKKWREEERDKAHRAASRPIVAIYPYKDERGELLFEVVRQEGKNFLQRRPGKDGWVWNLNGVRRVLYRLPEIQKRPIVVVVEGEKDVDRLWAEGIPATTSPGGAGKWKTIHAEMLRGADVGLVVIVPDNDEVGRAHAEQVARTCREEGVPAKVVKLPGLPEKGDVSDWLDIGNKPIELLNLVHNSRKERVESCPLRKSNSNSTQPCGPSLKREPVLREPALTRTPVQ